MNKYELCFHSSHGEPGKHKHFLTYYCKEGYRRDSKTDERLADVPWCKYWFTWNGGCSDLKPRKVRGGWVPRGKRLIQSNRVLLPFPKHNHILRMYDAYVTVCITPIRRILNQDVLVTAEIGATYYRLSSSYHGSFEGSPALLQHIPLMN